MTTPRIAPLTASDDIDEKQRELLDALAPTGSATNIFATFVRHPTLFKHWSRFGGALLYRGELTPRDREIAILRTAWRCQAEYEWGQHVKIGLGAGLQQDEIDQIPAGPSASNWSLTEATLLRAVDELIDNYRIADGTWRELGTTYSEKQLIELPFLVGHYVMVAMALNTAGVQREEGVVGLPASPAG